MSRVRVKMEKVQLLNYPTRCPCCLAQPAASPTPLVKGGAVVYTASWPHCEACCLNEKKRARSLFVFQGLAVVGLLIMAIVSPVLFLTHPFARWDGKAVLLIGASLPVVSIVFHKRRVSGLSRPPGAVRAGAGVMINYGGAHLLGGGFALDVTFLKEEYAREFVELNRSCITKVV